MLLCPSGWDKPHRTKYARVVELVDSLDSGSSVHCGRAGSSPASRTRKETPFVQWTKGVSFQPNPPSAEEIHLWWMKSLRDEIPLRGEMGDGFDFI